MVEVYVDTLTKDANGNAVVLLKEKQGARTLPITIGVNEAQAILCELKGIKPQRPMTHDLMRDIVRHLDARLSRVVVQELRDNIFYGLLVLGRNGKEEQVDARPSDALALALRAGAPIYVAEEVMQHSCELPSGLKDQPD